MNQEERQTKPVIPSSQKILNKTFYRFFFSFIAVIAGVMLFILVLGIGSEIQ